MYNNDTGLFDDVGWCEDAEWWEDENGYLYIVSQDAIDGPDDTSAYRLILKWCRNNPDSKPTPYSAPSLEANGLNYIWQVLRRFSPEDGYYHA